MEPHSIHVIDISENNLVELVRDIRSSFSNLTTELKTFCIDIGANEFEKFKSSGNQYDYVMNFSAMKHVRSERDPFSLLRMIRTNIINAYELAMACNIFQAKKYFCVSTDKAANPANFMGASKRAMEILLLHTDCIPHLNLARFANVACLIILSWVKKRFEKTANFSADDVQRYFITSTSCKPVLLSAFTGQTKRFFSFKSRAFGSNKVLYFGIKFLSAALSHLKLIAKALYRDSKNVN